MRTEHPNDEKDETVWFTFNDSANGYIELNLNMLQERPYTGWTIAPHKQPLRVGRTSLTFLFQYYNIHVLSLKFS